MSTNLSNNEIDAAHYNKVARKAEKVLGIVGVKHNIAVTNIISTVDQRVEQSEKPIEVHWLNHITKVKKANFEKIAEPEPPTAIHRNGNLRLSTHDEELFRKIHDYHVTNKFDTIGDYNEAIGKLNKDGVLKWLQLYEEMPDEQTGNIKIIGFDHNKEYDVSQVNNLDPDNITEDEKEALKKKFNDDGYLEGTMSPVKCVGKALVMMILDCIKGSKAVPNKLRNILYTSLLVNRIVHVHKVHYIIQNQRYSFGGKKLLQTIEDQLGRYRTITKPTATSLALGSVGTHSRESRKKIKIPRERQQQQNKKRAASRKNIPDNEHQAALKQRSVSRSDTNKKSMELYIKWMNDFSNHVSL